MADNEIVVTADGPLYATGDVQVVDGDGEERYRGQRISFCRCGGSGDKPFCDGSHREGFAAPGTVGEPTKEKDPDELPPEGVLRVRPIPNGPLKLTGQFELRGPDDGGTYESTETALCRCGASGDKPFCDGSHAAVEFDG